MPMKASMRMDFRLFSLAGGVAVLTNIALTNETTAAAAEWVICLVVALICASFEVAPKNWTVSDG